MANGFFEWIKQAIRELFPNHNTVPDTTDKMLGAVDLWRRMYFNDAPWKSKDVPSIGLPASIASEFAKLATVELKSVVSGGPRADLINQYYQQPVDQLREQLEYGCATGSLIVKPYILSNRIYFDYCHEFIPVEAFPDKQLKTTVFPSRKILGDNLYLKLEGHRRGEDKNGPFLEIVNKAYVGKVWGSALREVPLSSVPEWGNLAPYAKLPGVDKNLFGMFCVPFANNVVPWSPLGVSVYSRAVDLIRKADEQFGLLFWEFKGGALAVHVDGKYLDTINGVVANRELSDRLYRKMNAKAVDKQFYEVFAPPYRDQSIINGYNAIARQIEEACALSVGDLSDPEYKTVTATAINRSMLDKRTAVRDIQKAAERMLDDVLCAIDYWIDFLPDGAPRGEWTVNHNWGDSVMVTDEELKQLWIQEIRDGLRQPYEYRMRFNGEDEKTAKAMVARETLFGVT